MSVSMYTPLRRCLLFLLLAHLSLHSLKAETQQIATDATFHDTARRLRLAIEDLAQTFPSQYNNSDRFLQKLHSLETQCSTASAEQLQKYSEELHAFREKALLANPLLQQNPILFVARDQYVSDHHNTATLFQNGEINTGSFRGGGAIKILHLHPTRKVECLLEVPDGIARDPELNFDGTTVVFSMRKHKSDDYHIYKMNIDGTGLKQLTAGSEISDFDPMYLPTGEIVFISTREPKLCQCNRHIMGNLFKMYPDGSSIRQIGKNTLFEGHPCMMPDGRILYDRWEYVDKHFGPAQGLWTVNPDGTNHAVYYGNNAWSPGAILDARVVPDTDLVVATFGSCHDRPWGAIALVDRRRGLDGLEPVVKSWPADITPYLQSRRFYGDGTGRGHPAGGQIDNFTRVPLKYEDPYPLSEKYFLCSKVIENERTGIFLLDVFGNEVLVHEEKDTGCFDPMPVSVRHRPPIIPSRVDYTKEEGTFYLVDAYNGHGMEDVRPGAIEWLRVVEAPPKLYWTNPNWNVDATQAPAMNWNCTNNKRILGRVPVEEDGSAYFKIPSDKFVFFQLLDENGMMIQSMRSGAMVQPGEMLGCVGCHEDRLTSVPNTHFPLAAQRPPRELDPWYGEPRLFNYLTEIQPIFDKYCVQCHDYGKPAGETLNLSGDLGLVFNTSYHELRSKSAMRWYPDRPGKEKLLVKAVDDGPPEVLPAYSWGSHRSKLVDVIRSGHKDVWLDKESIDRIVTWIDMNAPYYGSYASAYPENVFGRSPLNNDEIKRLQELTGIDIGSMDSETRESQVNFTRPEWSPCLTALKQDEPAKTRPLALEVSLSRRERGRVRGDSSTSCHTLKQEADANYREALAIINKGKERLAANPRMDMPGAALIPKDAARKEKYNSLVHAESVARKRLLERKDKSSP